MKPGSCTASLLGAQGRRHHAHHIAADLDHPCRAPCLESDTLTLEVALGLVHARPDARAYWRGLHESSGGFLASEMWAEIFNQPEVQQSPRIRQAMLRQLDYESLYSDVGGLGIFAGRAPCADKCNAQRVPSNASRTLCRPWANLRCIRCMPAFPESIRWTRPKSRIHLHLESGSIYRDVLSP